MVLAALVLAGIIAAPDRDGRLARPVAPPRPHLRRLARVPAIRLRHRRYCGAGRRSSSARCSSSATPAPGRSMARRACRRQPGLAAGDPAVERARPPVLVVDDLPVRGLSGVRAGVDLRQPSRPGGHGRRTAAVVTRAVRRACSPALTCGRSATRSARSTGAGVSRPEPRRCADERPADGQPARASPQRAAGHGDRARCDRCKRWTTRSYEIIVIDDNTDDEKLWRPVEAWCARHGVEVRAPGGLARLQVGCAELRAARADRSARRGHRRGRLRLSARTRVPAPVRAAVRRSLGRLRPVPAGLPRLVARPGTTGGFTTPTSTSSPCPSRRGTSATGRSSPAPWA